MNIEECKNCVWSKRGKMLHNGIFGWCYWHFTEPEECLYERD
jgi:hypothetical protein